jgi:hypothetical protein
VVAAAAVEEAVAEVHYLNSLAAVGVEGAEGVAAAVGERGSPQRVAATAAARSLTATVGAEAAAAVEVAVPVRTK